MKPTIPVRSAMKDEELSFIREMGIEYVELNITREEVNEETLRAVLKRFSDYGLQVVLLSCGSLQKNKIIDLGLEGREEETAAFNHFVEVSAAVGIPTVSVAWQPNGIHRSGRKGTEHTRYGVSAYFDQSDGTIDAVKNDRVYSVDEIWDNFAWFLDKTTGTLKQNGVRMALHPNDPPLPYVCGVGSLVYRSDDYRRVFVMDKDNVVGVKFCTGCWLESSTFGNVVSDLEDFLKQDKVVSVHFRNVFGQDGYFEETLAEDGWADMYEIMKTLVRGRYDGPISIDHAFAGYEQFGGMLGAFAYPTGYMKGLMKAAQKEIFSE